MSTMKRMVAAVMVMLLAAGGMSFSLISDPPVTKKSGKIEWLSFEEGVERSLNENKKMFIDVYTDWCGYCKKMDRETFEDPEIAAFINENFIPVKFNAEQREAIDFRDHTFSFVASGNRGYHELAAYLLNNQLSYPTTVFLDEQQNMIFPVPGYHKTNDFDKILHYVAGEYYKTTSWKDFVKEYAKGS